MEKKQRLGLHVGYTKDDEKLLNELQDKTGLSRAMIFRLGLRALKADMDLITVSKDAKEK